MRIVVKVGSNVLTRADGRIDIKRIAALTDQVAWLRMNGHEVIIVSSGAVACGRNEMECAHRLGSVEQRQMFSALGQAKLINLYYNLFREYGLNVGQVLTTKENFSSRRHYLNQRACMSVMLDNGVIPIVNENDTVSITELMFTDNDELSGLIAAMMDASRLIILTNVDGIYDAPPSSPEAKIIARVEHGDDPGRFVDGTKSTAGRGGMHTKCTVAQRLAEQGVSVVIANGHRDNIIPDLMTRPDSVPHTLFVPKSEGLSGVKKWLAHSSSFVKGSVRIDDMAASALRSGNAVSLLMVGVTDVTGDFEENDIIGIDDSQGRRIAIGRCSYDSDDTRRMAGQHDVRPLVHCDYLFIEQ